MPLHLGHHRTKKLDEVKQSHMRKSWGTGWCLASKIPGLEWIQTHPSQESRQMRSAMLQKACDRSHLALAHAVSLNGYILTGLAVLFILQQHWFNLSVISICSPVCECGEDFTSFFANHGEQRRYLYSLWLLVNLVLLLTSSWSRPAWSSSIFRLHRHYLVLSPSLFLLLLLTRLSCYLDTINVGSSIPLLPPCNDKIGY